ncbi:MAG TPA: sugar MFS transporter [Sphingomonas sp.]|nr:sugar MFS transporter [Sphingomonas sp.]
MAAMHPITPTPTTGAEGAEYPGALAALASVFFMWGFVTALNDVLVPHLKSAFVLSYTEVMLIQFTFFSAYFIMSLPGAWLLGRSGYRNGIVIGLLTTAAGALLFLPAARAASYGMFLGALFVLASGITLLQVAANPYVALLGAPRTASSRLNLVQAFNSLGTTLAPIFGGLLILSHSVAGTRGGGSVIVETAAARMRDAAVVKGPYAGIAVALGLLALFIFLCRLPAATAPATSHDKGGDSLRQHPRLIFGLGALFFEVGAEISIGSFLINYLSLSDVAGFSHATGAYYVSVFWGLAMLGRLLGSAAMRRISPALVLGGVVVAGSLLLSTSIASGGWLALGTIVMLGFTNSIMFPTVFTLSIEGLGALTARGSALLIMAIVGAAVVPMAQGIAADAYGVRASFLVPLLCYAYVLFFAIYCHRARPRALPLEASAPHIG